jgi:hypothetical protein
MPSDRPLVKCTFNLYEGQAEELRELYSDIGVSAFLRRIIDVYLAKVKAGGAANLNVKVEIEI